MEKAVRNTLFVDAIFFADKIVALSIDKSDQFVHAVYDLANCYFLNNEFQRCIDLVERNFLV